MTYIYIQVNLRLYIFVFYYIGSISLSVGSYVILCVFIYNTVVYRNLTFFGIRDPHGTVVYSHRAVIPYFF